MPPRAPSIDRNEEYEQFITNLRAYHEKRGTTLDPEPKVGPRRLDLLRLYKRVTAEGGYDKVSDTKGNKLAWRRVASDFQLPSANIAHFAFLVKSAYYRNLAAYEISTFHKREPPPKEILEEVSARGGDLLSRTMENYQPSTREAQRLTTGNESDDSDERKTPGQEKTEADDPNSASGRATRSLRQAPPQRVLFGSEPTPAGRQTRAAANPTNSPTPGASAGTNGTYSTGNAAVSIANYEPRTLIPASVKYVATPANNAEYFRQVAKKMLAQRRSARGIVMPRGMMAPGTGFAGPSIYNRTLLALRSGVPAEVRYALHHLVKISHERGDKYRFDHFVGLAEALLEKILETSEIFYGFKWNISYANEDSDDQETLNGLTGTRGLIAKIRNHRVLEREDALQTDENAELMNNINEAGLVLRNMVMLDENAHYLAGMQLVKDVLAVVLQLPKRANTIELQHYALEITEQLTKYYILPAENPLYVSLLAQLESNDRGAIIISLRAISRIAMQYEERNRLPNIPVHSLRRICDWLLVEDEELRNACLDFLYQYTADTDNVRTLLRSVSVEGLVNQLSKDLMHGARRSETKEKTSSHMVVKRGADAPPKLSKSIVEQLCSVGDEREQSSQWLQTCFEPSETGEITQLSLWSAYNEAFSNLEPKRPLMQAKDFIQNVSAVFDTAQAAVVPNPEDQKKPRYTIRGIRPRAVPVDSRGRPFIRCLWRTPVLLSTEGGGGGGGDQKGYEECDMSVAKPEEIWDHVLSQHLGVQKDPSTGQFTSRPSVSGPASASMPSDPDAMDVDAAPLPSSRGGISGGTASGETYTCHWSSCSHFSTPTPSLGLAIRHVQTHLPDTSPLSAKRWLHNRTEDMKVSLQSPPGVNASRQPPRLFFNTMVDERNDAAGLPLASVLVLRNLARQMRRVDDADKSAMAFGAGDAISEEDEGKKKAGWVERCFSPVRDRIFYTMAFNASLQAYVGPLLAIVDAGMDA